MPYVMTDQKAKNQMLEELRQRRAEIDTAIERLEAEPVSPESVPDF